MRENKEANNKGWAEGNGSRTHQPCVAGLTGFEVRAHHRYAMSFRAGSLSQEQAGRKAASLRRHAPPPMRIAGKASPVQVFEHFHRQVAPDPGTVAIAGRVELAVHGCL